jgi:hypothetical protein
MPEPLLVLELHGRWLRLPAVNPAVRLVLACASGALACGSSAPTGSVVDAAIDSGAADTGVGDAGPTCPPAGLEGWTPPPYHHAQPAQAAACTSALIADFYASCLGPDASSSACDANWGCADGGCAEDVAHATCEQCLVTPSTNVIWGPVVDYRSTVSVNVAGCIELLDPANAACPTPVQQADECQHEACDKACPALADFDSCVAVADHGVCATYVQGSDCQATEADGGPARACVAGATFGDLFAAAAQVFCGGG